MIEIEINNSDIIALLNQITNKTKNRTPLMRSLAGTMESAVLQNFHVGGRPAWKGLKYREGMPLVDSENLMGSITSYYDNDSAVVGTNVAYAAIHQFGGKAGRGKTTEISARPFLQLTDEDMNDMLEDVQDYFRELIK
ncbi:phage virion morphogenesis protein [Actinobacillus sp. GY-402]|nr:phage virion morphogenesis protein [Actinobacillus sp. GY-402]